MWTGERGAPISRRTLALLALGVLLASVSQAAVLDLPTTSQGPQDRRPEWVHPLAEDLRSIPRSQLADRSRNLLRPLGSGDAEETFARIVEMSHPLPGPRSDDVDAGRFASMPATIRGSVVGYWQSVRSARSDVDAAFAPLDPAMRRALRDDLTEAWMARERLARGAGTAEDRARMERFLDRTDAIRFSNLTRAGATMLRAAEDLRTDLRTVDRAGLEGGSGTCAEGAVVFETPGCTLVVGAAGPNTYHTDVDHSIDLGGADVYHNNAGGTRLRSEPPVVASAIDLGTAPDIYNTTVEPGEAVQGAAEVGLGLLVDTGGNDTYGADPASTDRFPRTWSQGTGSFGVGILWDRGGNDSYWARNVAQGSSLTGYGMLLDEGGSDRYKIFHTFDSEAGQGTGCFAGAGALVDRGAGADVYDATVADMQGFGCAGGLGVLWDGGGSDDYLLRKGAGSASGLLGDASNAIESGWGQGYGELGGVAFAYDRGGDDLRHVTGTGNLTGRQAQGVGLGGIGVLLDDGGSDTYRANDIVQGAGSGAALGALMDLGDGDDVYEASTSALGVGLLGGTGWFVDQGGDDAYRVANSSIGVGLGGDGEFVEGSGDDTYRATNGSLGVGVLGTGRFVDRSGDDSYRVIRRSLGIGFGGLGQFVDERGDDTYRAINESLGVGIAGDGRFTDRAGADSYTVTEGRCMGWGQFGTASFLDGGGTDDYDCPDPPLVGTRGNGRTWVDGVNTFSPTGTGRDV